MGEHRTNEFCPGRKTSHTIPAMINEGLLRLNTGDILGTSERADEEFESRATAEDLAVGE